MVLVILPVVSDDVASTSGDNEKRAAAADNDDDAASSLMLAENMEAQQADQKLRAKRDLDTEDIRQLFASQNAPVDDYSLPGTRYSVYFHVY